MSESGTLGQVDGAEERGDLLRRSFMSPILRTEEKSRADEEPRGDATGKVTAIDVATGKVARASELE